MTISFTREANTIWRDYNTDGSPSSGNYSPVKGDIRTWGTEVQDFLKGVNALDALKITGGSIDGANIGVSTPAIGAFTTLSATGATVLGSSLNVSGVASFASQMTVAGTFTASGPVGMDLSQVVTANPLPIGSGGTGSSTADTALTALGLTAFGKSLVQDNDAGEARTTLGIVTQLLGVSGNYTVLSTDNRKHLICSVDLTLTLPDPSSVGADFWILVSVTGGKTDVVTAGGTIYGMSGSSVGTPGTTMYIGNFATFYSDGTNWWAAAAQRATSSREGLVLKATSADVNAGTVDTYPDSSLVKGYADGAISNATDGDKVFLRARIEPSGAISWQRGVSSVTKLGTGSYRVNFPTRASNQYVPVVTHEGTGFVSVTATGLTTTSVDVYTRTTSGYTDLTFFIALIGAQ